jgi:glycosyltransferase involved in cell wall biosynthesis
MSSSFESNKSTTMPAGGWIPSKAIITGGHEVGGLTSFAESLSEGFTQLGIPSEVLQPMKILPRLKELRDPQVLKILSTQAIFSAPFARSAICITHGIPTAGVIGWKKFAGHLLADFIANHSNGVQLATVSYYSADLLRAVLGLRIDCVIHNPIRSCYLETPVVRASECNLITYAGRLHPVKNLHLLLPAILDALDRCPAMRACIIGDGPERARLEAIAAAHPRVDFTGAMNATAVRDRLRSTKLFISGCTTEALGITYLEALSQGCNVIMPAGGGGLEIALELIGGQIQLIPLSMERERITKAILHSLAFDGQVIDVSNYSPKSRALAYIEAIRRFRLESVSDGSGRTPALTSPSQEA